MKYKQLWQSDATLTYSSQHHIKKISNMMRLSLLFIVFALTEVSAKSYSITMNTDANNTEIREETKDIEQQADNHFSYTDGLSELVVPAPNGAMQQEKVVTGTITDEKGDPLPGANVVVKGASTGVMADMNGAYSLAVPNGNTTLIFSFVGFVTKEIVVGNQTTISVILNENVMLIDEVVVVGYGQQKRVSLTGSVSQVS